MKAKFLKKMDIFFKGRRFFKKTKKLYPKIITMRLDGMSHKEVGDILGLGKKRIIDLEYEFVAKLTGAENLQYYETIGNSRF